MHKYGIDFYRNSTVRRNRYTPEGRCIRLQILILAFLIGVFIGFLLVNVWCTKQKSTCPMLKSHNRLTDKQWEMSKYFQKIGSPVPHDMAVAVSVTKKPRLMAAMAKVETRANPRIRYSGYKKRHHGAWQVNPADWGEVSHSEIAQALQAQDALEDFVRMSNGDIQRALKGFGGDSTDKYAKMVLAELRNVP